MVSPFSPSLTHTLSLSRARALARMCWSPPFGTHSLIMLNFGMAGVLRYKASVPRGATEVAFCVLWFVFVPFRLPTLLAATLGVRPCLLSCLVRKIVDIIHPGVANVSKSELGEMIAKVSPNTGSFTGLSTRTTWE